MLKREQKEYIVEELAQKLREQKIALLSDFHGVSVENMQKLRRALKKEGAEFKITRKTLFDRAFTQTQMPLKTKDLKGEIGIAFGYQDQIAAAKALFTFSKENETFKILGGVLDGKILAAHDIIALAKLPSRDILLAQIVRGFVSPIRGLVTALQGNLRNLIVVLQKIKKERSE